MRTGQKDKERGSEGAGEMQNVRNVSSPENTWPWQLLSNAELVGFFSLSLSFVLQLKLHYVAKTTRQQQQ